MSHEPMTAEQIRAARAALDVLDPLPRSVDGGAGAGPETGLSATLPADPAPAGATAHTGRAIERLEAVPSAVNARPIAHPDHDVSQRDVSHARDLTAQAAPTTAVTR